MNKVKWNDGWTVSRSGENPMMDSVGGVSHQEIAVTLPHDAMIHELRSQTTKNQHQTGFYPGGIYTYTKVFDVPEEWEQNTVLLEFEGVYMNAKVYINGDFAGGHPYGYTNFYICADDFLKYGQPNEIKVIANNSCEPNSRWYSGSGIYRNVNLMLGNHVYIPADGARIATAEADEACAVVMLDIELENRNTTRCSVRLRAEIRDAKGDMVAGANIPVTMFGSKRNDCRLRITIKNPQLWCCEQPYLYTCSVMIEKDDYIMDEFRESFGIRTLSLNPVKGLRINGKTVKLRGACIHHDNGIIGACTLERAEERRCQQLKAAGFNCIRSAHHPLSRAMLDACDREGILVLDELSDCWTRFKNHNDYAQYFPDYWQTDVERMVAKDYNHPSVIMYISGNEIQEAGTAKGAELNRMITGKFHELDSTRYVTVAVNGLLASMDHMGEIMCSITGKSMDELMQSSNEQTDPAVPNGETTAEVDRANSSGDLMYGPLADAFAVSDILSDLLEEFTSVTDLTGYNYLTARHELDHSLYDNRVILGTETLPSDIVRLWKIVQENPHVIGDMTWTGYDYLGEAGSAVFYYDGRSGFMPNWPISIAYMGDIDIIGYRRPMSYFREIVYGLRKAPYIAVERLNHYGEIPNKSAWMWKDEIASWTWHGYEGKPAVVNVYSDADSVELYLNGISQGRKISGKNKDYYATFEITYEPGKLEAVNFRADKAVERCVLMTAEEKVEMCVDVDRSELSADGADLAYLTVSLADCVGTPNLQAIKEITVYAEGAGTLEGVGSADPETENYYDNPVWSTYDGYLLAVVRSGTEPGVIKVTFTAEGCDDKEIFITVK